MLTCWTLYKSRHRSWSINYHLLSTNIYFKLYIIICIQCNYAVRMVWADQRRNLLFKTLGNHWKTIFFSQSRARMFAVPFLFCFSTGRWWLSTDTQSILYAWCKRASPDTWERWAPVRVYASWARARRTLVRQEGSSPLCPAWVPNSPQPSISGAQLCVSISTIQLSTHVVING